MLSRWVAVSQRSRISSASASLASCSFPTSACQPWICTKRRTAILHRAAAPPAAASESRRCRAACHLLRELLTCAARPSSPLARRLPSLWVYSNISRRSNSECSSNTGCLCWRQPHVACWHPSPAPSQYGMHQKQLASRLLGRGMLHKTVRA